MSLSRLALRLGAIEAANPSTLGADGPWPTIAGVRVYDSRIDPVALAENQQALDAALDAIEGKPLITFYTEDDHAQSYPNVTHPADVQVVTLVAELMIAAKGVLDLVDQEGNAVQIGTLTQPITDRQHEATLDMLEASVRYLIDPKSQAPSAKLFRKVAMEMRMITSDPQRAHDRSVRLAMRTVKFHIKVKKEVWPTDPNAEGLARLPEPLATVANGLADGSSGAALCAALAGLSPVAPTYPLLAGITIYGGLGRLPTSSANADVIGSVTTNP